MLFISHFYTHKATQTYEILYKILFERCALSSIMLEEMGNATNCPFDPFLEIS